MQRNKFYAQHVAEYAKNLDLEFWRDKRVLVTGATGMIGSALVDILLMANRCHHIGLRVYGMGRNRARAEARFNPAVYDGPDWSFVEQDVMEPLRFDEPVDDIIHAAGNAYPAAYKSQPVETMLANFDGTFHLLNLARRQRAKFLLVSSGEIYGDVDKEVKSENDYGYVDSMQARSCYPNGKRAAETLCASYQEEYGTETFVARLSHIYGPTMTDQDDRAVSAFLKDALSGRNIIMRGTGMVVRTYTYVFDACMGILRILERGKAGEAYNVADEKSIVSIRELADAIADSAGVEVIMDVPEDASKEGFTQIQRQVMSSAKLRSLGWDCRRGLADAIKDTFMLLQ